MSITWSNSDDENEGETTNKVMVFTRKDDSGSNYDDAEIINKELTEHSKSYTISGRKFAY